MSLRIPLTPAEADQAAHIWSGLLIHPGDTLAGIASSVAIPRRLAQRELAGLVDHNLVSWGAGRQPWYERGVLPEDRHYYAETGPHAVAGYRRLTGRTMPGTVVLVTGVFSHSQHALIPAPWGGHTWGPVHNAAWFLTRKAAEDAVQAFGVDPADVSIIRRHRSEFRPRKAA